MGGVLAVTAPLYLLMGLGWLAVRAGWFAREHMRVLGAYVLRLALPALLFNALASRRFAEILEPAFLLAFAGGGLLRIRADAAAERDEALQHVDEEAAERE